MSDWLEDLNPAQRAAVTYGDGPLLVIAGAGTGKTKTLASRVAWLVQEGVRPEEILLLTFTRRAAAEMIARAGHLTDPATTGRVWGGTFHAVANRLLRVYGRALQLPSGFTVMDEADAADLMNLIRSELGLAKTDRRFPRKDTLAAIYSRTVNSEKQLKEVVENWFPWCGEELDGIRQVFEQYTQRKREQGLLDYDDLLLYWNALCETPVAGESVADRFRHILVDEYQDTNAVQARILRSMRKRFDNIMVVGDDAQSIYSFRAATVRNILDFPRQFPGAHIVTLEQNYRSTEPILAASNAVMDQAKERYTKNLWSRRLSGQKPILVTCLDETEQSQVVCRQILEHLEQGIPLMRQAVLFRAGWHSDSLEVELSRRNIPFHKFGGLKFIEAAHVKDMLAFLRILENPYDQVSWFRVLQLMEGIGPKSARRVMAELGVRGDEGERGRRGDGETERQRDEKSGRAGERESRRGETPDTEPEAQLTHRAGWSPLKRLFERPPSVPPAARVAFMSMRAALMECAGVKSAGKGSGPQEAGSARKEPPLVAQIARIRKFYEPLFKQRYENANMRLRDLEQLEQIASTYRSRGRFITELTLDPPTSTSDLAGAPHLDEDWLTLSTIHSAKGCEWEAVYIIHAADGMIPSDMSLSDEEGLDEERRLFYVAMTRAKDSLYVYFPLRYYRRWAGLGDAHHFAQLTRFISPQVRQLFEERGVPVGRELEDEVSDARGRNAAEDVQARLRKLWGDA